MTDTQKFRTVAEFYERIPADLTVALLGDHGIPAGVFGADSSYPSLGYTSPITVKVNESDYDTAMAILAAEAPTNEVAAAEESKEAAPENASTD